MNRRGTPQADSWWRELVDHVSALRVPGGESVHAPNLHLAVMVEPYLTFVLDGKKTVESRFTLNRCAPYGTVEAGDIILLKRVGGPVCGVCRVIQVWYYELDTNALTTIRNVFGPAICAHNAEFWEAKKDAAFATLIRITGATRIDPIEIRKKDRRGWVTLAASRNRGLFDQCSC